MGLFPKADGGGKGGINALVISGFVWLRSLRCYLSRPLLLGAEKRGEVQRE